MSRLDIVDHEFHVCEWYDGTNENESSSSSSVDDVVFKIQVNATLRCLLPEEELEDLDNPIAAIIERYENDASLTKDVKFEVRARVEELTRSFVWNMFLENNVPVQDYMVEQFLMRVNLMKLGDPNRTRKVWGMGVYADIYVEELEPVEKNMEVEFVTKPVAKEEVMSLEKVVVEGTSLML